MKIAFIENEKIAQYPIGVLELRKKFPLTSFPANLSVVSLHEYGAVFVKETQPPNFNSTTETVEESEPIFEGGEWLQQWKVVPLDQELAESPASRQIQNQRNSRNRLLFESDWTQLPDAPVDKEAWASYRQKLRDITLQEGFPSSIEWPVAPEN